MVAARQGRFAAMQGRDAATPLLKVAASGWMAVAMAGDRVRMARGMPMPSGTPVPAWHGFVIGGNMDSSYDSRRNPGCAVCRWLTLSAAPPSSTGRPSAAILPG